MFTEVPLYDSSGDSIIETVIMPPDYRPPGVAWGSRVFYRNGPGRFEGRYTEGEMLQVFTRREYDQMRREGIVT